ncbi:trehalose-phosphatase [Erythrobacter sp. W53]|uniref:trehalose-phosphatase n=1 Tax=Erythrobacter sp. W53 TaxID=3425947 RepID=UPI003D7684B5
MSTGLAAPPSLAELDVHGPCAVFIDFDGTLVEIAETPDSICIKQGLVDDLSKLAEKFNGRMALVSGRSVEDLSKHLGSGLTIAQAGSHGADKRLADGAVLGDIPQPLPQEVIGALTSFAGRNELRYEAKTHGGALHYRENPAAENAAQLFAEAVAHDHGLSLKRGKSVVELVRPGADKGSAVEAFMQIKPFAGSTPIFIGDDVTDEDGFAACETLGGFGVLVGELRETKARYRLASVSRVHQWLGLSAFRNRTT